MLSHLKYVPLFVIISIFSLAGYAVEKEKRPAEENCKGFVVIIGSSNINQFQLINKEPKVQNASAGIQEQNFIRLPVHSFEATNNRMLNDFYDMVNASEHPFIEISIEPRKKADFDEGTGKTNFKTEVTIAGKSNAYSVPSTISACEHHGFMLEGDLKVKLTDFDIEPPKKFLGAIKVNNEVFIKFAFRMQHEVQLTESLSE